MKEINEIDEEEKEDGRPSNLIGNNNSLVSDANSLISDKNCPKKANLTAEDQKKNKRYCKSCLSNRKRRCNEL